MRSGASKTKIEQFNLLYMTVVMLHTNCPINAGLAREDNPKFINLLPPYL